MVFGIVWLVAFLLMCGGLAVSPHKVSGYPASVILGAQFVCGLALSLRALHV